MTSVCLRRLMMALVLGLPLANQVSRPARADPTRPRAALVGPVTPDRHPFPARGSAGRREQGSSEHSGGWWLGTAAIALVLALCGGISVAARR